MPSVHQRGRITEWQHTFSFSTKEKEYIEKHMEKHGLTFNNSIG